MALVCLMQWLKWWSDSSACRGICRRSGTGRIRHMETKWCWVQEALREGRFVLRKALTEENEADIGTKWLEAARLLKLLMAMNMRRISGPVLAALVIADQIATVGATSAEVGRQCRCNGLLVMVGALLTTTMVLTCPRF